MAEQNQNQNGQHVIFNESVRLFSKKDGHITGRPGDAPLLIQAKELVEEIISNGWGRIVTEAELLKKAAETVEDAAALEIQRAHADLLRRREEVAAKIAAAGEAAETSDNEVLATLDHQIEVLEAKLNAEKKA